MDKSTDAAERDLLVPLNRRNYLLTIANGIIFIPGARLVAPGTVLPLLILRLSSGLTWLIGLANSILYVVPVLPQLLASRWVDTSKRKVPIWRWCAVVRFIATLGMAWAVLSATSTGYAYALVAFFVWLIVRVLAQGVSSLVFTDIVARSVPTTKRGSVWMWRQLLGLALVLGFAVPVINYMLGEKTPFKFPTNYGLLLVGSALLMGIAWIIFSFAEEPQGKPAGHQLTMTQHLARGMRFLNRDKSYRRLMRVRILLSAAANVSPFFIAFAVQEWYFHDAVAATFLTVQILSQMLGCWIVGHVSDRLGNRKVLVLAAATMLVTATVVSVGAWLTPEGGFMLLGYPVSYRLIVLMVCFAGSGLFAAELYPGYINYLMDIAPRRKLPSYVGFASFFLLPLGAVPLVYGWLAQTVGYRAIFVIALLLSAVGLRLALRIGEPRDELTNDVTNEESDSHADE